MSALTHCGLVVVACVMVSCASRWQRLGVNYGTAEQATASEYRLQVDENRQDQRFDILLRSTTSRQLCIHAHTWPNLLGQLHFATEQVHVTIDGTSFPIRARNFGYCVPTKKYGCDIVVPPHGELRGFIAFSEFDPPVARDSVSHRELSFSVAPVICP